MLQVAGTLAVAVAVFALCVAVFGQAAATPRRLDAIRAASIPRAQYERLVSAEVPLWERILAPVLATALGKYVLLPAAALLEITGIALSWRITRLEA